jgi:hypothetical protein
MLMQGTIMNRRRRQEEPSLVKQVKKTRYGDDEVEFQGSFLQTPGLGRGCRDPIPSQRVLESRANSNSNSKAASKTPPTVSKKPLSRTKGRNASVARGKR